MDNHPLLKSAGSEMSNADPDRSSLTAPLLPANGHVAEMRSSDDDPSLAKPTSAELDAIRKDEMGTFVNGEKDKSSSSYNQSPTADLRSEDTAHDTGTTAGSKPKDGDAVEEDEPSDLSKSVTFAQDVAVYNLSHHPADEVPLLPPSDKESSSQEVADSSVLDPPETSPAILEVGDEAEQAFPCPPPTVVEPIIVPLRAVSDENLLDEPETMTPCPSKEGEGGADAQRHFQVTKVSEPDAPCDEGVGTETKLDVGNEDKKEMEQQLPSKLDKVDSYMSDSGNSTLSYNQDTIGPLENQSFLKNLNYSVSQAAMNEAGAEVDDLDLADFGGVKADVDGGWAWVILLAACCSLMVFGATTFSAGVFMPYILEQIEPDISMASWIGAVHSSASCLSGPTVSSVLSRLGARWTAFLAGMALVGGLAGSFFATSFTHLIIAHGLLAGIGNGYILNTMYVVTGQYFNRYRGFACSMLATGAGVGILAVGSVLTFLLETFGLNGAYLMWAGICSHVLIFAMLLRPSCEELIRDVEKKISKEQIKNGINTSNSNSLRSGMNSMASGLNSIYSNGDVQSAFSGRTNYSRSKLRRHPSKRSSRGDLTSSSYNPLLKNVLNQDVSNSRCSVNTNRSQRSNRSNMRLSNGNLSLAQNAKLLDSTLLSADGYSLVVPSPSESSPLSFPPSRASNYTISPLALPENNSDYQSSPTEKSSSSSSNAISPSNATPNHIHSNFSLANEIIPEHEVVSKNSNALNPEPPPSPTFSRSAPSEFRKRLHSNASQDPSHHPSHHTSYSQISHGVSMRGPMRNGDLDNESLTSTLVLNLRPKDVLEPRYRLGSRSIPTLVGSVLSFPTSLAIVKDDLSRIEAAGEPMDKSLREYLISLLDSLRILRKYPFLLFICTCFLWAMGEAPFCLYLPAYAISQGTSPSEASSLYTAIGFGSIMGRFLSGMVASDRMIGPLLFHIGCLGLAASVVIFTPIFASSLTSLMLCGGLFGVYTGSLVPLSSLITIELLGIAELGMGFGFLCMMQGLAFLLGPPLGGVIVQSMGFQSCFIFFGFIMTLGSLLGMTIAVVLGREVGGEEDDDYQGSLDDLERALRRVSNCMTSGSEDEDEDSQAGSPDPSIAHSRNTAPRNASSAGGLGAETDSALEVEKDQDEAEDKGTAGGDAIAFPPADEVKGVSASPSAGWFEEPQVELETITEEV